MTNTFYPNTDHEHAFPAQLIKLIADAEAAGFDVSSTHQSPSRVHIYHATKPGIHVYEDGSAIRDDVRLDLTANLSTYALKRSVLGI